MDMSTVQDFFNITYDNIKTGIIYAAIIGIFRLINNAKMSKNKICERQVIKNESSKFASTYLLITDIFITFIASLSLLISKNYLFGSLIGIDTIYQLFTIKKRYWNSRNIATVYKNGIRINGIFIKYKNGENIRIRNNIFEFSKNGKMISIEMDNEEIQKFIKDNTEYKPISIIINDNNRYDITIAST